MQRFVYLILLLFAVTPAAGANLRIFTCEPEWAALATELAGENTNIFSATTGLQNPHKVTARPSLIAKMRRADLVICTGADLEAGWLPLLRRKANNPKVLPGQPGYLEAADHVPMREIPSRVDRAEGDVHPHGNPHIHTDPRNIRRVAQVVSERLATLDPANATQYRQRLADFNGRWDAALRQWESVAANLRGMPIVTQHKSWIYLIEWLGLERIAVLEAKPGLPPSAAHLSQVAAKLERRPARVILRAAYQDRRASDWLADRTGLAVAALPYTVGGNERATDLFGLFDETLRVLNQHANPEGG